MVQRGWRCARPPEVGVRANDLRLAVGATLVLVTLMLRPGLLAVAAVVVLVTLMLRPDP